MLNKFQFYTLDTKYLEILRNYLYAPEYLIFNNLLEPATTIITPMTQNQLYYQPKYFFMGNESNLKVSLFQKDRKVINR